MNATTNTNTVQLDELRQSEADQWAAITDVILDLIRRLDELHTTGKKLAPYGAKPEDVLRIDESQGPFRSELRRILNHIEATTPEVLGLPPNPPTKADRRAEAKRQYTRLVLRTEELKAKLDPTDPNEARQIEQAEADQAAALAVRKALDY